MTRSDSGQLNHARGSRWHRPLAVPHILSRDHRRGHYDRHSVARICWSEISAYDRSTVVQEAEGASPEAPAHSKDSTLLLTQEDLFISDGIRIQLGPSLAIPIGWHRWNYEAMISEIANDLYSFPDWETSEHSENQELNEDIWQKYPGF